MTARQLREIWEKTNGHCHFCGDPLDFWKRGWVDEENKESWEVDHVIQRGKGGVKSVKNCLPASTSCNRLRRHRKGKHMRELLILGLIAKGEIKKRTDLGEALLKRLIVRRARNKKRRV